MSYVRWSAESDVYIIDAGDHLICHCERADACAMCGRGWPFRTTSRGAMLKHIAEHRLRGEVVPIRADERIREEIAEEGDVLPPMVERGI